MDTNDKFLMLQELSRIDSIGYMGKPTKLFMYCVLNSIDLNELISIYLDSDVPFKKMIEKSIIAKMPFVNKKAELFDKLFELLKESTYLNRLGLRKCIEQLLPYLDDEYKNIFFDYFINSKYQYEYYAAISMTHWIWSDGVQDKLLKIYSQNKDSSIIKILERQNAFDSLTYLIEDAWINNFDIHVKNIFIKNFNKFDFSTLQFLKNIEPSTYLKALNAHSIVLSDSELIEIYNNIPLKNKPWSIWDLVKMNKWDIIKNEIQCYIDNDGEAYEDWNNGY